MPYKNPERQKEAQREWVQKNRAKANAYARQERAKRQAYIESFKQNPCMDCNQSFDPCVMDFHHRNGDEKIKTLAQMVHKRSPYSVIDAEMAKCDLLCANCHRLRHKGLDRT